MNGWAGLDVKVRGTVLYCTVMRQGGRWQMNGAYQPANESLTDCVPQVQCFECLGRSAGGPLLVEAASIQGTTLGT